MALQDLTFDEAEAGPSSGPDRLERYKGTDGCVDRVAIVFFRLGPDGKPDLGKARFLKGSIRFHAKLGSVLVDDQIAPELWETFEEAREKSATLVLKYPTTSDGKLIKTRLNEMRTMLWEFGGPTLQSLKEANDRLAKAGKTIGSVDLVMTCKSARYQRFDIQPAESSIWRTSPEFAVRYMEKTLPLYQQVRLGREMTETQIREALGLQVPLEDTAFDETRLDDLLEQV